MSDYFYLLYKFEQNETQKASYKPIILFTKDGALEESRAGFSDYDLANLIFSTKEELIEFTKIVLEELNLEQAIILSANDLNIGLDSVHSQGEFRLIFENFGTRVLSDKKNGSSKSLLGRFF